MGRFAGCATVEVVDLKAEAKRTWAEFEAARKEVNELRGQDA